MSTLHSTSSKETHFSFLSNKLPNHRKGCRIYLHPAKSLLSSLDLQHWHRVLFNCHPSLESESLILPESESEGRAIWSSNSI